MRHTYIKSKEMGATNSFESEVLRHIIMNEAITNMGDAGGLLQSVLDGDIFLALFTSDPGEAGSITNEAAYTGYARVPVPRDGTEWEEASGQLRNLNSITFPECTAGSETITHFGLCKTLAGDDLIIYGELSSPALMAIQVQPRFEAATFVVNLD